MAAASWVGDHSGDIREDMAENGNRCVEWMSFEARFVKTAGYT